MYEKFAELKRLLRESREMVISAGKQHPDYAFLQARYSALKEAVNLWQEGLDAQNGK